MKNNREVDLFLENIIGEIEKRDVLQSKRIQKDVELNKLLDASQFDILLQLIFNYFRSLGVGVDNLVSDYLQMVADMRFQRIHFIKTGAYSCKSQQDAYDKVYSNNSVMSYYMNGLLISQLLWHHHFNTYVYFKQNLNRLFKSDQKVRILDVGPGHGFYSFIVKNNLPNYQCIDLIDISESSLEITKKMIGHEDFTIHYFNQDVLKFDPIQKYDLIILGEVIEHLDDPHEILLKLSKLLTPHGILWVTAPTNAPAIDHVFLFKNKAEILDLIEDSDLKIINEIGFYSDKVTDEVALKNKVTHLICAFCKRK